MNCLKKTLLSLVIFAMTAGAQASLLIEPHIGYILPTKKNYSGADFEYKGPQYGARLGAQFLGIQGGFSYAHSSYKTDVSAAGVTISNDRTRDEIGVFAGYKFPILLRAWLGYSFSTKEKQDGTTVLFRDGSYLKGKTTELGVGFTGLPIVNLNLVYKMHSYDDSSTGKLDPKYEPKELVLSLSAPFTLL